VIVPSFLENCPYVVLEAMACGTPVIASKVGGIPEMIDNKNNGMLFEPGSIEGLTNAIVSVLADSSLRSLMSQGAKDKIAKNFSWDVNIGKYLEVYSEAMNQ
jgi:starch synthase